MNTTAIRHHAARWIISAIAASAVIGGQMIATDTRAEAITITGTVANSFQCSLQTGRCQQVNPPFAYRLPVHCRWVYTPIYSRTTPKVCNRWV